MTLDYEWMAPNEHEAMLHACELQNQGTYSRVTQVGKRVRAFRADKLFPEPDGAVPVEAWQ